MITLTVGEFKARFSEVIEMVKAGKSVAVMYGKKRTLIGIFESKKKKEAKRTIGVLKGKLKYKLTPDFKFSSEEEFLGK